VDSLSGATSFSAVLQNTGFTLWRHYNKLAKPLPDVILNDNLRIQEMELKKIESFLILANNIQGIALFDGYSADLY
jgi:hypothetical protein